MILSKFPQFTSETPQYEMAPVNVLYFVVIGTVVGQADSSSDSIAVKCEAILSEYTDLLKKADIRRVSFVFPQEKEDEFGNVFPALFTPRLSRGFSLPTH